MGSTSEAQPVWGMKGVSGLTKQANIQHFFLSQVFAKVLRNSEVDADLALIGLPGPGSFPLSD